MVCERIDIDKHKLSGAGVSNHFITSPCGRLARCESGRSCARARRVL